ncbi:MAG: LuxR C-terminal-related transcriptional regulator [Phycisphaerales bacterium]|nr:LuxR C-terminal-related transcriptional regulator [Phycisphaerales bacterium]
MARKSAPPQPPVPFAGNPLAELKISLGERSKELECLYGISHLRETHPHSPKRFLQGVVDRLPRSWRYPPFACARIKLDDGMGGGGIYTSERFHEGPWQMSAEIRGEGKRMGEVEVWYRKGVPVPPGGKGKKGRGDGPFLKEETALLRAVAERIATALLHMKVEADLRETHRQLHSQHQELQETNIALRTVLSRLEEDKQQVREAMIANVQKIIMPIVYELELAATGRQQAYVTLLRRSLQEITSPFLSELSSQHLELTPGETAICAMIRNGLATKEIAQIRGIAIGTVRRHRENIRRKLGLHNRAANLVTYLQSTHQNMGGGAFPSAGKGEGNVPANGG